ncbi:MAG: glycosyltransferase family 9 protein, partial [Candidatus Babeliales bacterium]|nr:glycosyltransferase family 9 protein [Candidatus Babeliales bacterium]
KGKRVLIRAEWGLGDMIQFMRYAKILKHAGATVILQAFDPLLQLFKRCDFLDGVIGQHDSIPPVDIHIPLLSLPLICGTILETIPADIPYIFADPILIDYWHEKLKSDENLKVGICWHSKPIYIEDHMFTRRSIALEEFIPLALEHVSFYSLQKEFGTDEIQKIASSPLAVATFDDDFDVSHGRFSDTAAVIMNMDLVITADTSIVHVAGALGKQVWVLLPYAAEWRWLPSHPKYAHSSSTPWYPNMRLFRQTTPGDWTAVIHEVRQALIKLVKK